MRAHPLIVLVVPKTLEGLNIITMHDYIMFCMDLCVPIFHYDNSCPHDEHPVIDCNSTRSSKNSLMDVIPNISKYMCSGHINQVQQISKV